LLIQLSLAVIKVIDILSNGDLNINQLYEHVRTNKSKIKLLAIAHVYNGTGVVNPIKSIIEQVKSINNNILILVDGAQAVPNFKIDVQDLKCDFYAFSGHKIYGPTGIGVLYGKSDLLNSLPPYHGGGEMIDQVILPSGTTYAQIPHRFEAGTPDISGVIGLSAAIDYLKNLDFTKIITHKANLLNYCTQRLATIENLFIIGTSNNKVSLVAFTIDKLNPQDIGLLLDQYGIAVRTGHHCNMPLMTYLDLAGTIRVSFGIYNTIEEIDIFIASLKQVIKKLK
jgi:cysteine desulfurase/selenocysteine lyase